MDSIELERRPRGIVEPASAQEACANDSTPAVSIPVIPAQQYPRGVRLALITLGLVLSIFLAALDQNIIATAIPSITTEFGSISNIAWYGSAYGVTQTAFQSAWGKAYKYFPLKPAFLLSIAIFEAGNVICAAAGSSDVLIFGRVVAGLGGGGVMTGSFIIIALSVKEEHRAAYLGVVGVTFGISSVVGPLMGGALTDGVGWRWCFWVSLPIGGLAAIIHFFAFRSPLPPTEASLRERIVHMDLGGGVLVAGFLSCFVLAMQWGGTQSWSQPRVIISLLGFGLFVVTFIINEWWMDSKAMVQGHLIRNKRIAANLSYIFFLAGVFFPLLYILPVQFQSVDGTSASQSGIRLIPLVLGISVLTMIANGILTYWRHYKPFLLAGALLSTIGVSCITALGAHTSAGTWVGFELLTAVGVGLALQIPMIANQAAVGADDIAAVTAITLFVENCGTTLFVACVEAAFTQGLMGSVSRTLPNFDPEAVLNAGATQIRNIFEGGELDKVLSSYLHGCQVSHIVSVACGIAASVISLFSAGPAAIKVVKMRLKKSHAG